MWRRLWKGILDIIGLDHMTGMAATPIFLQNQVFDDLEPLHGPLGTQGLQRIFINDVTELTLTNFTTRSN